MFYVTKILWILTLFYLITSIYALYNIITLNSIWQASALILIQKQRTVSAICKKTYFVCIRFTRVILVTTNCFISNATIKGFIVYVK